jgi:hemolysin activation/secretion protein
MSKKHRIKLLTLALIGTMLTSTMAMVAYAAPVQGSLPDVEISRTKEYLERERLARQIAEDLARKKEKIEGQSIETSKSMQEEVSFVLTKIITDKSQILDEKELAQLTHSYEGRTILVRDLYELIGKINKLYNERGYITCRAILPPQTIKDGVAHIRLLEGKTGKVTVKGNNSTKEHYITRRLHLKQGDIANVNTLNKDLLLFNGTNDVQLRIKMKAGSVPGTTDYELTAWEPQKQTWTVYSDNGGSTNSGEYRGGLFFTDHSLTGTRDALTLSTLDSKGMKSFGASYSREIGRSGTKLNLLYNTNSVKIISGDLEPLDVRGHANSYTVGLVQPLIVNETTRAEAGLEYNHQNSKTDFLGMHWLDDTENDVTASFALTNYGNSHIFYQKHSYVSGGYHDLYDSNTNYGMYKFSGLYQKTYKHGQMLNDRLDAQWSSANYLPSARQFYIGGAYSVRGYEENLLSGDSGYSFNLEYSVPLNTKNVAAYAFYDQGGVYGDSAFENHILTSLGIGVKATLGKKVYANLALGWPLRRDINGTVVDGSRVHFVINGTF